MCLYKRMHCYPNPRMPSHVLREYMETTHFVDYPSVNTVFGNFESINWNLLFEFWPYMCVYKSNSVPYKYWNLICIEGKKWDRVTETAFLTLQSILSIYNYRISRPIRRTVIFSLEILEKKNYECILILVIYWKKTGLLHTKISNHNIIYSSQKPRKS